MHNRTALVFGATGLVGRYLINELKDHVSYTSVVSFLRTPKDYNHLKIVEQVIDFDKIEDYAHLFKGDDLFICLGTTISKAGSVKKMEEIDRDLPIRIAQIAFRNGVKRIAVVSSLGANPSSGNYYMRIKGEMEKGIMEIPFAQIVIARPSMLFGRRKGFRFGEFMGRIFMTIFGFLFIGPLRKYRGIKGKVVAEAMIALIKSPRREIIYPSDELQRCGKR
jgi:uncharacterized protein YbjT (DUF2867 family)